MGRGRERDVMDQGPGELDGFAKFFAEEHAGLVLFLFRHGAGYEDARDAAQESFVRAYLKWGTIVNPRTWIRTTAVRIYRRQVLMTLRGLPVRQREVMAWKYDGFSVREIGEFIGITDDAVRASLYQARRRLRRRLGERGDQKGDGHD